MTSDLGNRVGGTASVELRTAAALRWQRPLLTAELAAQACVRAVADGDDPHWAQAAGWLLDGLSAGGDARDVATAVLGGLTGVGAPDDAVPAVPAVPPGAGLLSRPEARRLRVGLAAVAQADGEWDSARALVAGLPDDAPGEEPGLLRLDRLAVEVRCALADPADADLDRLRAATEACAAEFGGEPSAFAELVVGSVHRACREHDRAVDCALRGLAQLGWTPARPEARPLSAHLAAALLSQWITALLDAGRVPAAAVQAAAAQRDVTDAGRQGVLLRLTLARAEAGRADHAARALAEAAAGAAAAGVPALVAACRNAQSELHESAGRYREALEAVRGAAEADRLDRARGRRFRHAVAAVLPLPGAVPHRAASRRPASVNGTGPLADGGRVPDRPVSGDPAWSRIVAEHAWDDDPGTATDATDRAQERPDRARTAAGQEVPTDTAAPGRRARAGRPGIDPADPLGVSGLLEGGDPAEPVPAPRNGSVRPPSSRTPGGDGRSPDRDTARSASAGPGGSVPDGVGAGGTGPGGAGPGGRVPDIGALDTGDRHGRVANRGASDRDAPGRGASDRDASDRGASDRDASDRDASDRDASEQEAPHRDTSNKDAPHGDSPARGAPDGDASDTAPTGSGGLDSGGPDRGRLDREGFGVAEAGAGNPGSGGRVNGSIAGVFDRAVEDFGAAADGDDRGPADGSGAVQGGTPLADELVAELRANGRGRGSVRKSVVGSGRAASRSGTSGSSAADAHAATVHVPTVERSILVDIVDAEGVVVPDGQTTGTLHEIAVRSRRLVPPSGSASLDGATVRITLPDADRVTVLLWARSLATHLADRVPQGGLPRGAAMRLRALGPHGIEGDEVVRALRGPDTPVPVEGPAGVPGADHRRAPGVGPAASATGDSGPGEQNERPVPPVGPAMARPLDLTPVLAEKERGGRRRAADGDVAPLLAAGVTVRPGSGGRRRTTESRSAPGDQVRNTEERTVDDDAAAVAPAARDGATAVREDATAFPDGAGDADRPTGAGGTAGSGAAAVSDRRLAEAVRAHIDLSGATPVGRDGTEAEPETSAGRAGLPVSWSSVLPSSGPGTLPKRNGRPRRAPGEPAADSSAIETTAGPGGTRPFALPGDTAGHDDVWTVRTTAAGSAPEPATEAVPEVPDPEPVSDAAVRARTREVYRAAWSEDRSGGRGLFGDLVTDDPEVGGADLFDAVNSPAAPEMSQGPEREAPEAVDGPDACRARVFSRRGTADLSATTSATGGGVTPGAGVTPDAGGLRAGATTGGGAATGGGADPEGDRPVPDAAEPEGPAKLPRGDSGGPDVAPTGGRTPSTATSPPDAGSVTSGDPAEIPENMSMADLLAGALAAYREI